MPATKPAVGDRVAVGYGLVEGTIARLTPVYAWIAAPWYGGPIVSRRWRRSELYRHDSRIVAEVLNLWEQRNEASLKALALLDTLRYDNDRA